jgi:phage shock protein PspC (stress-responsive transcriptional regulator)
VTGGGIVVAMDETTSTTDAGLPPAAPQGAAAYPPPRPPRPPLQRSRTDRVLGGVCGGIGRYFDIDPTLVRVLFVVLTIFTGGLFLLVWLVLLLVMPEEPVPVGGYPPQAWGAAASEHPGTGAPTLAYAAGGTGQFVDPASGMTYGQAPPPTPAAPREPRSYLGLATVSAAAVLGGVLALAASLGADVPAVVVLAAMLGVLGLGLVVGAWRGRARWLAIVAALLLGATAITSAAHHIGPVTPVGDRTWVPTASSTTDPHYELGTGSATLDLRRLSGAGGERQLHARVGYGELRVLVPADVRLVLDARVGIGELDVAGESPHDGLNNTLQVTLEPLGSPTTVTTVELDAEVGVGDLEVRRAAS